MAADLDALEKQISTAESAADLSELTAQILVHVAAHSDKIATNSAASAGHLKSVADNTGASAGHLKSVADNTGASAGHLKSVADNAGTSAGHLKDLADKTGDSTGHLKTLAEKAVESARYQDTIATALQAGAHRGAQGNPLYVTFEHPREIKVTLHEETLSKIVAVWTGGDGAVDNRVRRELLEYLLMLRNAVAGALTSTHKAKFEEATLSLAEKCAAERVGQTAE